jgi:transcriptional regulator GlxA family with amidase domain
LGVNAFRDDGKLLGSLSERPAMIASETDVESPGDVSVATTELHRERVVVRKRRSRSRKHHHQHRVSWTARASRRRAIRVFVLCAGVLVLMAVGLYFGLARENNSAPAESSRDSSAIAAARTLA